MSQKSLYGTKTLYAKFELDLRGEDGREFVQVLEILQGAKNKFSFFIHFGVRKFRHDERIPNLVSKLKSDNI